MGRLRKSSRLIVALNGALVGSLERSTSGAMSFTYARSWLDDVRRKMPVSLSLPLREESYSGSEVSAFFDNLLPEDERIRLQVARRTGAEGVDAFSLLNKIGRDCVGALQFLPDGYDVPLPAVPESETLSTEEVLEILRNLATAPLGIRTDGTRELRISIAGAQEKTALFWNGEGWALPLGATPTTHILKPQLGRLLNGIDMRHSVENEHFCMRLCEGFGLKVAESEIVDFEDIRVLSVERFDRLHARDGRLLRLPQEDFCQALGVPFTRKYNDEGGPGIRESIQLLSSSDYPQRDRIECMKAHVVFWMIGATDGHAKNFSIFLSPGGRFSMAPLYDILSTEPNYAAKEIQRKEYRLAMAVGDNRHYRMERIFPRHFMQDAKATGISEEVLEELFHELSENAERTFESVVANMSAEVPEAVMVPIGERIRKTTRLLKRG